MNQQKQGLMPNELRIGNAVLRPDLGNGKKRMETILQLRAGKALTSGPINVLVDYSDLEGVEITEDVLSKVGFERTDKGSVSAQFNIGENPITNDHMIQLIWLKDHMGAGYPLDGFPFYRNGHFEMRYLHQLQNLYHALTFEELDVTKLIEQL